MKTVKQACKEAGFDPLGFLLAVANGDHKAIGEKDPIPKKERRKAAMAVARHLYRVGY